MMLTALSGRMHFPAKKDGWKGNKRLYRETYCDGFIKKQNSEQKILIQRFSLTLSLDFETKFFYLMSFRLLIVTGNLVGRALCPDTLPIQQSFLTNHT